MKPHQLITPLIVIILFTSCANQRLFSTKIEGNTADLMKADSAYHHIIQKDDKISLSIWNHNDMSIGSVFSIYNSNQAFGKWILVDAEGQVKFPEIGNVRLEGLTCPEAADTLTALYAEYLINPIIVVKVLNREITVLGEVRTAGTYLLENEWNTVTEIIGKAQGFKTYADLENIKLIRNGISYTIDLTQLNGAMEHTVQVESNDIIYVPSLGRKGLDQKAPTLIPFASTLTAIAVVASIILR